MAGDSSSEENVGNSRWYCHACEEETETVTEVVRLRLCRIGASAYDSSSKDRKGILGYQPNTPTSCST